MAGFESGITSFWQSDDTLLVENPYEDVDWSAVQHLHGGSHMHTRSPEEWQELYDMGIRHLSLTNYYPSEPIWPLPDEFLSDKPDLVTAPNAEHHGTVDHSLHFTTLGSFYTTGYGRGFSTSFDVDWDRSPFEYTFTDLNRFNPDSEIPGEGVYRLDLRREPVHPGQAGQIELYVTLEGARVCDHSTFQTVGDGSLEREQFTGDETDTVYFCVKEEEVKLQVEFDPEITNIDRIRVMQGANRPWRIAFSEALDGERTDEDGQPIAGLLYPDGGGVIINHPRHPVRESIEMLEFDERVLGVEVWNHRRWFGLRDEPPHMEYYTHWDSLLAKGHRAYGFFVKDHRLSGRGRNILLVPDPEGRTMDQRQKDALRAYRNGRFYGLLGAWDRVDGQGRVQQPYDRSSFSFQAIELIRSEEGVPQAVRVRVEGHDTVRRPNIQIRFITELGVEKVVNQQREARFNIPGAEAGRVHRQFVRVEAYAYPNTHNQGEPLTAQRVSEMNVYEIARIHDRVGFAGNNDVDGSGQEPIGTVDMLFSQPIQFIQKN
ncbi:MAG: hypothetical protein WD315_06950 [Balneolaceae bacterium]